MERKVTQPERVLRLAGEKGVLRASDLTPERLSRQSLRRLRDQGRLVQVARGLYSLPDAPLTEHHSLAEVARRVPQGVICLLSALRFHNLTTQEPHEVWLALPLRARQPISDSPLLQTVRMSQTTHCAGVSVHVIENVPVPVYSVAKTVVDCFKYRNKVGLDVALEALREGWRDRRFTLDELDAYARLCRVANVMRPYVEVIVS